MNAFDAWVAQEVDSLMCAPSVKSISPKEPVICADVKTQLAYVAGVYLLVRDGEIVYVGQSGNVYSRIAKHMDTARFEFDSFSIFICVDKNDRLKMETELIHKYQPPENRIFPAYGDTRYEERSFNIATKD